MTMRSKLKRYWLAFAALAFLTVAPAFAPAQPPPEPTPIATVEPTPTSTPFPEPQPAPTPLPMPWSGTPTDLQMFIHMAFVALLPYAVDAVRKLKPNMPRALVWIMGPALGLLLQWLLAMLATPGMAGWKGFLAGLVAVAVHSLRSSWEEHGTREMLRESSETS